MDKTQAFLIQEYENAMDNFLYIHDKLQGVEYTNDDLDLFAKIKICNLIFSELVKATD
jgi:hypothetical protein